MAIETLWATTLCADRIRVERDLALWELELGCERPAMSEFPGRRITVCAAPHDRPPASSFPLRYWQEIDHAAPIWPTQRSPPGRQRLNDNDRRRR
jgi:hypothetical protein